LGSPKVAYIEGGTLLKFPFIQKAQTSICGEYGLIVILDLLEV